MLMDIKLRQHKMTKGEYSLQVPVGIYTVMASKDNISQTIENVEIFANQITTINFQLGGEQNMEYIKDINILNCEDVVVEIPDGCSEKRYKCIGAVSGNPYIGNTVELLSADESTILQTTVTNSEGFALFTNLIYNSYKLKIIY